MIINNKHVIPSLILIFYICILAFLGAGMHISVHDILDDFNFMSYIILANNPEYIFASADTIIPHYLGGLSRDVYPSELSLYMWVSYILPPYGAYIFNQILIRIIAYIGMFCLINQILADKKSNGYIPYYVACCFALLPFWPQFYASIAAGPLVIWAFMNLVNRKHDVLSFLIIILFPFYSHFIFGGMFLILVGLSIYVRELYVKKRNSVFLLYGITLLSILSIVVNYRLFRFTFFSGVETHRDDWGAGEVDFFSSAFNAAKYLFFGQEHAAPLQFPVIIITAIILAIIFLKERRVESNSIRLFLVLPVICLLAGFYNWELIDSLKALYLPFLFKIQLDRIYFLLPIFGYLFFAASLLYMSKKSEFLRKISYLLLVLQIIRLLLTNQEIVHLRTGSVSPSFEQFFARDLFENIKHDISLPMHDYRVGSVGIHPAIAAVNGMMTIDGYSNLYPLPYKRKFRNLIEIELGKSPELSKYYDEWGSRAYLFSSELGRSYVIPKNTTKSLENFELNVDALHELGCQYIISSVQIRNAEYLELVGEYSSESAYYKIFLYRVSEE